MTKTVIFGFLVVLATEMTSLKIFKAFSSSVGLFFWSLFKNMSSCCYLLKKLGNYFEKHFGHHCNDTSMRFYQCLICCHLLMLWFTFERIIAVWEKADDVQRWSTCKFQFRTRLFLSSFSTRSPPGCLIKDRRLPRFFHDSLIVMPMVIPLFINLLQNLMDDSPWHSKKHGLSSERKSNIPYTVDCSSITILRKEEMDV